MGQNFKKPSTKTLINFRFQKISFILVLFKNMSKFSKELAKIQPFADFIVGPSRFNVKVHEHSIVHDVLFAFRSKDWGQRATVFRLDFFPQILEIQRNYEILK
jgi:hypothetical protein